MAHIDQEVNNETFASNTTSSNEQEKKMETTTKTTIQVLRGLPGESNPSKTEELRDVTYSPDELTVVTTVKRDVIYSKINVFDGVKCIGKVGYTNHYHHTAKNVAVPTLGALEAELRAMNDDPLSCVIRGQLFDELTGSTEIRRKKGGGWEADKYAAESEDGVAAMRWAPHCFTDVPRSWACFDVDGKGDAEVIFPGAHLWTDETPSAVRAQQTAAWLVNVWMPKAINHKDAVVQWSSSYALDGRLERVRAHVWVRFTSPLTSDQLTSWVKIMGRTCAPDGKQYIATKDNGSELAGGRRLDYATVGHAVQPNFTAAPLFNLGGELIPSKTDPTKFVAVKGGTTFPDPHHDYRVLRVNGRGSWGNAVVTTELLGAIETHEAAAIKKNAKSQGHIPTGPKVATVQAPIAPSDWTSKDRADYELGKKCLTFLGPDVVSPRDEWIATGCSIKSRFPGPEGLALWTEWSLTWEGSDPVRTPDECDEQWATFSAERTGGPSRGFGRLINEAKRRGMTTKTTELQNENENEKSTRPQSKSAFYVEGVGEPADDELLLSEKLDDYGMAQRLNRSWGNRLRFIEDEKRWVVFSGGRWELVYGAGERAPKGAVAKILDQVVERLSVEGEVRAADASRAAQDRARAEGQTDALIEKAGAKAYHNVMREYRNYQKEAHTDAHRSAVLGRQAVHSSSMGKDWDIENHLLGASNGVVNLRTGELLPYTYDRLSLQRITTSYDSAAPDPEIFIRTVTELMSEQGEDPNNPTDRTIGRVKYQMFQLAYFLTGETCRQKLSIWHGIHGGNGKSLLTSLMQRLLGPVDQGGYYVTVDPTTVLAGPSQAAGGARPDLVKLKGARLAVVRDIRSGGARLDTSLVKSLASGEPVPARGLYDKNLITFDCKAKLVIVCNTIPAYETDGGMTRRIEALHYDRRWDINGDSPDLPPADVDLLDKLTAELPRIFAYLVRLAVQGYAAQWRIEIPPSVKAHSAEANDAMNDVASFLEQCTVKSPGETTPAGKLLGAYNIWAKGMRARTMNKNDFADDLKRMGYEKKITMTCTVYVGIRLIENQYGGYDN